MSDNPKRAKESSKDNSYHPFAKEEKSSQTTAVKHKPQRLGSGLLNRIGRKNVSYGYNSSGYSSRGGYNPHARNTAYEESNSKEAIDFLTRLSCIALCQWEDLLDRTPKQKSNSTVNEVSNTSVETKTENKSTDKPSTPSKEGQESADKIRSIGQDYSGSYLFTRKPEKKEDKGTKSIAVSEGDKKDTDVSTSSDKPKPKLPPNAVRLGDRPTQLPGGVPVGPSQRARESMRETEPGASSRKDQKTVTVKINERAFDIAKERVSGSLEKLLDYVDRPPQIRISPNMSAKFKVMQIELSKQLNGLKQYSNYSAEGLSSDLVTAQSISNLAVILGKNIDILYKSAGKIPDTFTSTLEPVKNEMLRFKASLQLLVECLPSATEMK